MRKWVLIGVLAGAALLAVGLVATTAFAAGPRGRTAAPAAQTATDGSWVCPMGGGYGMMGGYGTGDSVTLERVAGVLGLTYDALVAQIKEGKSIAQIAETQGVALAQVVETILAPHKEMLQVKVKYGYLTQEQADTLNEQAAQRVETALSQARYGIFGNRAAAGTGWGRGHMGGRGGMMGGGMMGGFGGGMMGW